MFTHLQTGKAGHFKVFSHSCHRHKEDQLSSHFKLFFRLQTDKRNLMSPGRMGLKNSISKDCFKTGAGCVRCSCLKGRGMLTGFFDSIIRMFEDMNISKLPSHFPYIILLPFAVQLHICWPESFEEHNCFFLLAVCRINHVVDMKISAKN